MMVLDEGIAKIIRQCSWIYMCIVRISDEGNDESDWSR